MSCIFISNKLNYPVSAAEITSRTAFCFGQNGQIGKGNEITLIDVLGTSPDMVAEEVENQCEQERLNKQISRLSSRERWVLEMRFGMPDGSRKTQRDIARILGISRSYVSRIEKRAIGKLCKNLSIEDNH